MYTENKSMAVLTKKSLSIVIWMKKYVVHYLVILLLQIVAYYLFLCEGYFIKEFLMEVHPPLSDGGGSTSFTDLR